LGPPHRPSLLAVDAPGDTACLLRLLAPAGLTKLLSQLSREGGWQKALELFEALEAAGLAPDTTLTNAAISACGRGGQWERALKVFNAMQVGRRAEAAGARRPGGPAG
jgi:pentatricopeptide repeat protein